MGTLTVHTFKEKDKKWKHTKRPDIDPGFCNSNYLYQKYFPHLPLKKDSRCKIPLEHFNFVQSQFKKINLEWYEKVCFRLTSYHNFFTGKDKNLVIKALSLMESANPTTHPQWASFNVALGSFLSDLKLEDDEAVSFGHSVGGFWGTDSENLIESISTKISAETRDKLLDNTNFNPFIFGRDIFDDYSDEKKLLISEK